MSQPVKTMSLRLAMGAKSLMRGLRPSVRLPRRMVSHLGERADGFGEAAADGFYAGDECGGDGSHAGNHDA